MKVLDEAAEMLAAVERAEAAAIAARAQRDRLRAILFTLLNRLDYRVGNCRITDTVADVLPRDVIQDMRVTFSATDPIHD